MTKCYGIWYGGYSYARSNLDDLEEFDSYADAERCLRSRYNHGNFAKQTFRFVHRKHESNYCPAVDMEATRIFIYTSIDGELPDRIISFGPKVESR